MSKYRCDDKAFRTQITKLADAGLTFPTASAKLPEYPLGTACSLYRARPCSECKCVTVPVDINGVPAYVRTIEPPTRRGHFNLPGLIAGLIFGALLTLVAVALALAFFGGAH